MPVHTPLGLQDRQHVPAQLYAYDFSWWKRAIVRDFFAGSPVRFVNHLDRVPLDSQLIVWGKKDVAGLDPSISILRLEDGFVRSVGLGADLVRPLSWVIDDLGIYYDATQVSRLEQILQQTHFSPLELQRAEQLIAKITTQGITKYNMSGGSWSRPITDKPVLLVTGQVEADASITFGSPAIKTNIDLVKIVRSRHANAYLVYKPHPDVVAGLRDLGSNDHDIATYCDEIVTTASMAEMLDLVDEVHVLTSLTGFEALLRNKRVVCYGQPFYSGWGLTEDYIPSIRRNRVLSVEALVAGALIKYPRYISRVTRKFTSPETAIDELIAWREKGNTSSSWWRKWLRPFLKKT
jgi:capsular polysaccharide export protein